MRIYIIASLASVSPKLSNVPSFPDSEPKVLQMSPGGPSQSFAGHNIHLIFILGHSFIFSLELKMNLTP